jgi:Na+(H+)/acetate symporter ActP
LTLAVVLLVLAAGFVARTASVRWARTTSDLFIAIRPPSPMLLGAGLAAEHLSAPLVVAALLLGASAGPGGAWLGIAFGTGLVALSAVAAAPIRRAGVTTPSDVVVALWGDRVLADWLHRGTLVAVALLLVPVVQVAARSVAMITPLRYPAAATVAGVAIAASVAVFRGRGSLYAQPVRMAALVAGLGAAAALGLRGAGLDAGFGAMAEMPSRLQAVSCAVAVVVGTITAPQLWPRLQAAGDPGAARQAVVIAIAAVGLLGTTALAIASSDISRSAPGPGSGIAARLLVGLIVGGILSGCLAAGSALLLGAIAAARRLQLASSPALVAAVAAAVALALAWQEIGILTVVGWGFTFTAATSSPIVIAALWWRGFTSRGARWGAATGSTLAIGSIAIAWYETASGSGLATTPALVSIPAAAIAGTLASLSRPSDASQGRDVAARLRFHRPGPA